MIANSAKGSVRDALSLLDRALVSTVDGQLSFEHAQKIFGFVDKSSYIDLIEFVFNADEESVIKHYRSLYCSGVEPSSFLNEFLELLYYIKNIKYISYEGTNFTLNNEDYKRIQKISSQVEPIDILLFWEFSLKTIKEINLVSNQNLSVEMFLIQLIYISKKYSSKKNIDKEIFKKKKDIIGTNINANTFAISQIKNINQLEQKSENENKKKNNDIKNIDDLIEICAVKKEIQLKHDLENNVNLVSFSQNRIEITFNDKLNKNFVKELSEKLYEWTKIRWIISFSKKKGKISNNEEKLISKDNKMKNFKNSEDYSNIIKTFPDIQLIDIKPKND